jgi:hypothetical protein
VLIAAAAALSLESWTYVFSSFKWARASFTYYVCIGSVRVPRDLSHCNQLYPLPLHRRNAAKQHQPTHSSLMAVTPATANRFGANLHLPYPIKDVNISP